MSNFIKSFRQHISEEEEEEEEKARHSRVKRREQEAHLRVLDVGDKEGEEAEKIRHRSAKRGEQQRHVGDHRSKYKKRGHHTSSYEEYENE